MGYAQREAARRRADMEAEAVSLTGLRVAVDVQHLWKPKPNDRDRGAAFALEGGAFVHEADLALAYAQATIAYLRARGAAVLANDPAHGILVGAYPFRNRSAADWSAHVYLACHVNAGGGGYALVEYPQGTAGAPLAAAVGRSLFNAFPTILARHVEKPIGPGVRGWACIGRCITNRPALLLEPFFGDHPSHRPLMTPDGLKTVGHVIGAAVAAWWKDGGR